jgi:hypothetical protein
MIPVNYAWYLAHHEPEFEARLKNSYDEGTAWSCAHGTGRWKADCGCHTGGEPGWNQAWREPLREALNELDVSAMNAFDAWAPALFKDVEIASQRALELFHPQASVRSALLTECVKEGQSKEEAWYALELLRFSHYMFTSCGWFFTDLAGIETLQILKYALRTLQILESRGEPSLTRERLLKTLKSAHSNTGPTGADIFTALESEALPAPAYLAMGAWTEEFSGEPTPYTLAPFWKITERVSRQSGNWTFHAYRFKHSDFLKIEDAWLAYPSPGPRAETYWILLGDKLSIHSLPEEFPQEGEAFFKKLDGVKSVIALPIKTLPADIRELLAIHLEKEFWSLHGKAVAEMDSALSEHAMACQRLEVAIPAPLLAMRQVLDAQQLQHWVFAWMEGQSQEDLERARVLSQRLNVQGIRPDLGHLGLFLERYLAKLEVLLLHPQGNPESWMPFFHLLDLIDALRWSALRTRLENIAEPLFDGITQYIKTGEYPETLPLSDTLVLLDRLNFNVELAKSRFQKNLISVAVNLK